MKPLAAAFAASAACFLAGGCTSEKPPGEVVQEHLQRGVTGQGQLGPLDRSDDPYVHPRVGDASTAHP